MSRNFELLDRVRRERAAAIGVPEPVAEVRAPQRSVSAKQSPSDELRKLVQRIFLLARPKAAPRMVVFSAVDAASENNWICAQAAELLAAQVPDSVCILDARLPSPSLEEYFCVEAAYPPLTPVDETAHIRDLAVPLPGTEMWLLSGRHGKSGSDVAAPFLRTREHELRASFDYVLIDAPPIGSSGEALRMAQLADGIVLIVEANSTRRDTARRVQESLKSANVKLQGVVLTERTYPIPESLYRFL